MARYSIVRHEMHLYCVWEEQSNIHIHVCVCGGKECSMWDYDTSKTKEFDSHTRAIQHRMNRKFSWVAIVYLDFDKFFDRLTTNRTFVGLTLQFLGTISAHAQMSAW